jgi:hypothetical protein
MPFLLEQYYSNLSKYGHLEDATIIVIPDKKTPVKAEEICDQYKRKGLHVDFMTLESQVHFMDSFQNRLRIPYNSDNRRNIGYLSALQREFDFIVSIDDDNYATDDIDFYEEHAIVCRGEADLVEVSSSNQWYNIFRQLDFRSEKSLAYARGFPYFARLGNVSCTEKNVVRNIHVNAGLWLGEPDMDGMSWLTDPVKVFAFKKHSIALAENTWAPINSQNTSLRREAIAAYYFIAMGYPLAAGTIDRFGDIFSGYFLEACSKHLGGGIRFGSPCVEHMRNNHNYLKDAAQEIGCILLCEDILNWLTRVKLTGNSYIETYESLSHLLEDSIEHFDSFIWNDQARAYFHQICYYMRIWASICREISGNQ